jgi:hypothetical protein
MFLLQPSTPQLPFEVNDSLGDKGSTEDTKGQNTCTHDDLSKRVDGTLRSAHGHLILSVAPRRPKDFRYGNSLAYGVGHGKKVNYRRTCNSLFVVGLAQADESADTQTRGNTGHDATTQNHCHTSIHAYLQNEKALKTPFPPWERSPQGGLNFTGW